MRVVGILKATSPDQDSSVSSAFYRVHRDKLFGPINEFVNLRRGQADFRQFQADVQKVTGRPTNVVTTDDLFGQRQLRMSRGWRATGSGSSRWPSSSARACSSARPSFAPSPRGLGSADLARHGRGPTDHGARALGPSLSRGTRGRGHGHRRRARLSPRFPIGLMRRFELDLGIRADWLVLALTATGLVAAVVGAAWVTAVVRIRHGERVEYSTLALSFPRRLDLPPALLIGSWLATDPGRGRRAVPVRSALVGSIVGVIGVVGCLTFRQGITDTVHDPARSGVVWN